MGLFSKKKEFKEIKEMYPAGLPDIEPPKEIVKQDVEVKSDKVEQEKTPVTEKDMEEQEQELLRKLEELKNKKEVAQKVEEPKEEATPEVIEVPRVVSVEEMFNLIYQRQAIIYQSLEIINSKLN